MGIELDVLAVLAQWPLLLKGMAWTLGLTAQGQGPDDAKPAPAQFAAYADAVDRAAIGASPELDARLR